MQAHLARFPCQVLAILLACRYIAVAVPLPMQLHHDDGLGAAYSKAGHVGTDKSSKDYKIVQQYTLTETHRNGQSYTSDEYRKKTGDKLVVKPGADEHGSPKNQDKNESLQKSYFRHRTIHEAKWRRKLARQSIGAFALKDLTDGHVVRNTDHEKDMLLHRNEIPPSEARRRHENNEVIDRYHGTKGLRYEASAPLYDHWAVNRPIPKQSHANEVMMHHLLANRKPNAQTHLNDIKTEKRKYYDAAKGHAVEDPVWDTKIQKLEEEKKRTKRASATSASTSRAKTPSPKRRPHV
jgi:hypothetical protein